MKAYLLYSDHNLDLMKQGIPDYDITERDLEIQEILNVMAEKDTVIRDTLRATLRNPLQTQEEISYRHEILEDAVNRPDIIMNLYGICVDILNEINKYYFGVKSSNVRNTFATSVEYLGKYLEGFKDLRSITDKEYKNIKSRGLKSLFELIKTELSDEFLKKMNSLINELKTQDGILIHATLGPMLEGTNYILSRNNVRFSPIKALLIPTIKLKEEDMDGRKNFDFRQDKVLASAANALLQSSEHLESFYTMLRSELAFYVGNINLMDFMKSQKMPFCIPSLTMDHEGRIYKDMYDVALLTKKKKGVTGNDLVSLNKSLFLITGANQGGKTTFLRSFGQAQLMAQAGMLVGAEAYSAPFRSQVYTHFKKEEDKKIKSGKLDEELKRMSTIIDEMNNNSLILFNESFTSTNEREGSEINKTITDSLLECGNEILSVTHLYTFSSSYLEDPRAEFLIAERENNGGRTHHILKGLPEKTAYGEDLYKKVFGN